MVIEHRSEQVVCSADGVEVAGEVQVDVFHRNDLRIAAACCTALDAEDRAQRRLTQSDEHVLAELLHAVGQADSGRGLAFTGRGGVDGGDQNQLAVGALDLVQDVVVNLGLVLAILLQVLIIHTSDLSDLGDGPHLCFLCDFDVGFEFCHCCSLLVLDFVLRRRSGLTHTGFM